MDLAMQPLPLKKVPEIDLFPLPYKQRYSCEKSRQGGVSRFAVPYRQAFPTPLSSLYLPSVSP